MGLCRPCLSLYVPYYSLVCCASAKNKRQERETSKIKVGGYGRLIVPANFGTNSYIDSEVSLHYVHTSSLRIRTNSYSLCSIL